MNLTLIVYTKMKITLSIVTVLLISCTVLKPASCTETSNCENSNESPEFLWNPANQYVTKKLSRFYELGDDIKQTFLAGNYATTRILISEYLELADIYCGNWNYGNAIHDANRYLGLISLDKGELDEAAAFLVKSGKTPGSPQLDSFGPELDLANFLLQKGRSEEVKIYLNDIKSFWDMDRGLIDKWVGQIQNGETPVLSRHSQNNGFLSLALIYISLIWPFIIAAFFIMIGRKKIRKTILFGFLSVIFGYLSMILFNFITPLFITILIGSIAKIGNPFLLTGLLSALMMAGYIAPILVSYICYRYLKINNKNTAVN